MMQHPKGVPALIWAAKNGHERTVEAFIEAGADVNVMVGQNWTPLLVAIEGGHTNIVRMLLAAKANANVTNMYGRSGLWHAIEAGYSDIAILLINAGASIHWNSLTNTALYRAACLGLTDVVIAIIAKKFNINIADEASNTPLHFAASNGHTDTTRVLIENGADVLAENLFGYTPLQLAALKNDFNTVRVILENHRANFNLVSHDSKIALELAESKGHDETADVIREVEKNIIETKTIYFRKAFPAFKRFASLTAIKPSRCPSEALAQEEALCFVGDDTMNTSQMTRRKRS